MLRNSNIIHHVVGKRENIENIGTNLTSSLPELTINFVKSLFSGIGNFLVGLIIGFYLIVSMDDAFDNLVGILPTKMQGFTKELLKKIDDSLRGFVQGAFFDSTFVTPNYCLIISSNTSKNIPL